MQFFTHLKLGIFTVWNCTSEFSAQYDLKRIEEKHELEDVNEDEKYSGRKRPHSQLSVLGLSQKNSSLNMASHIDSISDCSDCDIDTSFFKPDSSIKKNTKAKTPSDQLYQTPSKLDNWNTEHR